MTEKAAGERWVANVFIGLGSNLGDRRQWLAQARAKLQVHPAVQVRRQSSLYRTEPVGLREQPEFLNQVVEVATRLTAPALLELLLQIEKALGRIRERKWGPRTIDLDLLAYDQLQFESAALRLPHPALRERRFVLAPWAEIAPDFLLPDAGLTVAALLRQCPDHAAVIKLAT
ncbi:MAG: 2-amino-4-hydroxy-6-hydroxymethyldihydropteridine diphosphokinase [candidate division KSB1 bacterium]|nr:2-amino-4-hydroxy-6-hydroxymethyldihydropteridine diphosphokinase [candidate division KSB1 bacterium]MDZ7276036.1 2-amino-4-hydroxy-6-hydroxymethyldihydropteridine diphosphokinase [candidate division KSB1 bacterium]MDZ7349579.1 2-amino-4-hydroxy-6-hydroxymethyldihydropteridine diphosphokinase [candidate division KSB1 bacterium]MDZ7396582.1 2-amino-4-hydroxy-6-hydroxymethyldihydropteridine diphosphokinase [candidate division KSB1 bacterium]MDZ7417191.1 2-amino-4-hydroxy-6-hydroxymethyldihydro